MRKYSCDVKGISWVSLNPEEIKNIPVYLEIDGGKKECGYIENIRPDSGKLVVSMIIDYEED